MNTVGNGQGIPEEIPCPDIMDWRANLTVLLRGHSQNPLNSKHLFRYASDSKQVLLEFVKSEIQCSIFKQVLSPLLCPEAWGIRSNREGVHP